MADDPPAEYASYPWLVSEGEVMVEIVGAERPLRASGEVEFAGGSLRLRLSKGEGWLEW